MAIFSKQAQILIDQLKEFDKDDFEVFWTEFPKFTPVGTERIIQYLEMKRLGVWKEGKLILRERVR